MCPELLRMVLLRQPRSMCPDQCCQMGRQPPERRVLCRKARLGIHGHCQGNRGRLVPDGGPRGQRCSEGSESLGLCFPVFTAGTEMGGSSPTWGHTGSCLRPHSTGQGRGRGWAGRVQRPRQIPFPSPGLHLFDLYRWK